MKQFLKITGLIILAAGVIIGYADLMNWEWLRYKERTEFLDWVNTSTIGLPIDQPPAKAFMQAYPPPANARIDAITHITKSVLRQENGLILQASINYMLNDHTRASYVATLTDVQKWATESRYPWLSWALSLFGFIEILLSTIFDWRENKKEIGIV